MRLSLWVDYGFAYGVGAGGCSGLAFSHQGPDILVDRDAKFFGINLPEAGFSVSAGRQNFVSERWPRRAGQAEFQAWPRQGSSTDGSLSCDNMGCLFQPPGLKNRFADLDVVALVFKEQALKEDCRTATIVISLTPVRRRCPSARLVIDRFDLWRHGAHAIWLEKDGPRVVTAADIRGHRPWVRIRGKKRSSKSIVLVDGSRVYRP